jgi:NADH-quinone oxidoreductase subunit K
MIPIIAWFMVSAALFATGLYGILTTRSSIKILICVELLINAAHINFAAFASYHHDVGGIVFVLFGIAIAAAEAAVGISVFLNLYRVKGSADLTIVQALKG